MNSDNTKPNTKMYTLDEILNGEAANFKTNLIYTTDSNTKIPPIKSTKNLSSKLTLNKLVNDHEAIMNTLDDYPKSPIKTSFSDWGIKTSSK